MQINKDISAKLTNLTFVWTLAIVLLHLPLAGVGSDHFVYPVFEAMATIAVPSFFAISGFLLAKNINQDGWYLNILKKRFHSLVIPYVAINALYIPALFVYHNICHLGTWEGNGLSFNWYTISRIWGLTYKFHPACGPIWYIRCLIMFLFFSPLLVFFIKKSKICAITLCAALFGLVSCLEPIVAQHGLVSFAYSFFSLRGLVFFVIGISYGFWAGPLKNQKRQAVIALSVAIVLTVIDKFLFYCSAVSLLSWLLFAYAAWLAIPSIKLPVWLTASSFAIYSLHMLMYWTFAAILKFCGLSDVLANSCCLWLLPLMLTLSICYSCTYLVRHHAPWVGKLVFGGRC